MYVCVDEIFIWAAHALPSVSSQTAAAGRHRLCYSKSKEPTCLHSWCVDSKVIQLRQVCVYRFTSGEHLCPAPPCSCLLVCTAQRRRQAQLPPPGCHGDRSVLVNDRVHVEEHSRCRVSEFAQAAPLCAPLSGFSATPRPHRQSCSGSTGEQGE